MSEVRLIDEAALINEAETGGWDVDIKELKMILKYVPEINAAPVVRGEWVKKTYIHEYANEETEERQYVVCGICGKQPPSGFGAVNFCPNCGAKMEDKP